LLMGMVCLVLAGCEKDKEEEEQLVADLSVTMTSSPQPVKAGENLSFAITVTNNGPDQAQAVVVRGELPAGMTFVSAGQNGSHNNGVVSWNMANMASGTNVALSLVVSVNADVSRGTSLQTRVTVSSDTSDPSEGNNSITGNADVEAEASLSLTMVSSSDTALAGEDLTYSISVENKGPNEARNVRVSNVLPSGLTFVSASNNGSHSSGTVSWNLGNMASGATAALSLVVSVDNSLTQGTAIRNTATVSSDTDDPDTGDNSATNEAEVGLPPDEGPVSGEVTGTINLEAFDEQESETTVSFNRICHTIEKFTELQSQIATTPQGAVVMMIIAMRIYQQYPIEGMKCMTATCTSPLTVASSAAGSYEGRIMSNVSTLRERLAMYDYLPFIYYQGATPQNGYTPDGPPFVVNMYTNMYSYSMASDGMRIKLFVETKGADSDRPVTVTKVGNIYKVTEFSSLYLGPKPPVK
jgi:uncharacterized repeat protein (TIGR01451 family)